MIKNVLMVCVGNICRSPMAEGLLRNAQLDLNVTSAGLGALVGKPAEGICTELMATAGIDISQHRATQLTGILANNADLILVMESGQKHEIQRRYPAVSGKVFRLGELGKYEIPDPYRQPREAFESAFAKINLGVQAWVPRIQALR